MGCTSHDALACVVRRRATGGDHVTRRDAEHVCDETSGIGPGPSGCRDGVGTGVERVITFTHSIYILNLLILLVYLLSFDFYTYHNKIKKGWGHAQRLEYMWAGFIYVFDCACTDQ